jgi:hypothetical protein
MASKRGTLLADDFAAVNDEAVTFARSCTDEQWAIVVPGEEWTVGVVLHHIAEGHSNVMRWLHAMARGEAVTDTVEIIDETNVEHAGRAAAAGQEETAELLTTNGTHLETMLRNLSDVELDRTAPFGPAGGRTMPTEALAEVTARHVRGHLDHARAAVEEAA